MKVKIGKYVNWFGIYQLTELLTYVGMSKDATHDLASKIDEKFPQIGNFLQWVHSKKKRTVKVHIDDYDVWNMDSTLTMIILPMLKKIREDKHGAPYADDSDVPEGLNLRSTEAPIKENEWDTDDNLFKRWEWIVDEMIWTFTQLHPDTDWEAQYYSGETDVKWEPTEKTFTDPDTGKTDHLLQMVDGPKHTFKVDRIGMEAHQARITNGLRLFGKYYQHLWT